MLTSWLNCFFFPVRHKLNISTWPTWTSCWKAVPLLRRLVYGLSRQRFGFDPRSIHVGFVVPNNIFPKCSTPILIHLILTLNNQLMVLFNTSLQKDAYYAGIKIFNSFLWFEVFTVLPCRVVAIDVSEDFAASIFRVIQEYYPGLCLNMEVTSSCCWKLLTNWHSIISQRTWIFINSHSPTLKCTGHKTMQSNVKKIRMSAYLLCNRLIPYV